MKKVLILLICVFAQVSLAADNPPQNQPLQQTLEDGFVLNRIDGTITAENDKFFFAPETDITSGKSTISKGCKIQLLPSNTLEKIAQFADNKPTMIRLSATVTKYRSQNFLFPTSFLAVTAPKAEQTEAEQPKSTEEKSDKTDGSILPDNVLKKLNKPKAAPIKVKPKGSIQTEPDRILHRRTGFITFQNAKTFFEIDALGRNVDTTGFKLLPCRLTEKLEYKTTEAPTRQRLKATGIITKYKDTYYLLPSQAVRTYNHGNFAR